MQSDSDLDFGISNAVICCKTVLQNWYMKLFVTMVGIH